MPTSCGILVPSLHTVRVARFGQSVADPRDSPTDKRPNIVFYGRKACDDRGSKRMLTKLFMTEGA